MSNKASIQRRLRRPPQPLGHPDNPLPDGSYYQYRGDGRKERVCEHGVGHTVFGGRQENFVHGCDSCCAEWPRETSG